MSAPLTRAVISMFVFITYINSLSVVYVCFIDYVTEGTADIMKDFAEHQFPDMGQVTELWLSC